MFRDREEAGRLLAAALLERHLSRPVVLALPRGGVPVAAEVARALHAPLDLLLVRKIGAPHQPELAVAAVAEGTPPSVVVDEETLSMSGADHAYVARVANEQLAEIERRRRVYLRGAAREPLAGRTVVVVDDGLATGSTMRAALQVVWRQSPARVVLAVPVAPAETVRQMERSVDDLVCLRQPEFFGGVGAHYEDFHQVGDDEVIAALDAARSGAASAPMPLTGAAAPRRDAQAALAALRHRR
ncbi:MAG TPA: phosphoribosyltransferase family protein [Albitalea sp.]|nr:phosphoribosyltransferase family protein [Albitalea sp.]